MSSELQAVTAATTEMRASTESVAHGVNAASGEAERAVGATVDELQSSMSVVVEQ